MTRNRWVLFVVALMGLLAVGITATLPMVPAEAESSDTIFVEDYSRSPILKAVRRAHTPNPVVIPQDVPATEECVPESGPTIHVINRYLDGRVEEFDQPYRWCRTADGILHGFPIP